MKVYISGPITGFLKDEVITAFSSAETKLKEKGCIPVNPLNNGLPWNSSWEDHMKRDIQLLLDCDAIYLLDNYKQSKGALLELHIAEELGLTIMSENIFDSDTSLEDIIELPSRTLKNECTPYKNIQKRADFLANFKDGWALFNSNALFRSITTLVMNGVSEYDLMLELIFMIDGKGKPNFPLFKSHNPTHNETE